MQARRPNDSRNGRLTSGKKLIVFYVGDTEEELPLPNAVVFRTSLKRGIRPDEFATTVFFEDFVGQRLGSHLPLRPKLRYPTVGFCGFAGYRLMPMSASGERRGVWLDGYVTGFLPLRCGRGL